MKRIIQKVRGYFGSGKDKETQPDGGTVTKKDESSGILNLNRESDFLSSLPFWLPPFLLMGLFVYGGIGWNLIISLTDFEGFNKPSYNPANFDFQQYTRALGDSSFWAATRNTLVLLIAFTVVTLVLGLILAILIDQKIRFENTFRTIYLLPMSLSFVVTAVFWSWMYSPSSGLINIVLGAIPVIGDSLTVDWLGNPTFKLPAVIFALIWQFSGYAMVVYLAGLRAIPTEHYEAAKVDGVSSITMYRKIIIPQLRASTLSALVVLMVFSLKAFDFIYVILGKTPGPSADILALKMYREAFVNTNFAYGAAIAIVLFVMALAVVAPYTYRQYKMGEL